MSFVRCACLTHTSQNRLHSRSSPNHIFTVSSLHGARVSADLSGARLVNSQAFLSPTARMRYAGYAAV